MLIEATKSFSKNFFKIDDLLSDHGWTPPPCVLCPALAHTVNPLSPTRTHASAAKHRTVTSYLRELLELQITTSVFLPRRGVSISTIVMTSLPCPLHGTPEGGKESDRPALLCHEGGVLVSTGRRLEATGQTSRQLRGVFPFEDVTLTGSGRWSKTASILGTATSDGLVSCELGISKPFQAHVFLSGQA